MPTGTIDPNVDYVANLANNTGKIWPVIGQARVDAADVRQILSDKLRQFTSDDVDIVVFGSLARREWTNGSDVDWTMLIDGQASCDHRLTAQKIENELGCLKFKEMPLKGPGSEGIFGNMTFSHEIVHHIGGQADTNRNSTQRILLLLEAIAVREPKNDLGPSERIVRQILQRYLVSDSNFHTREDDTSRIPRFLLNDVVRYWRTMCVDFAYKDWEQAGKKWALRNIKLRTSRKLLFVSGLLTVFGCFQNDELQRNGDTKEEYLLKMQGHLLNFVHSTPLNIISWALQNIGLDKQCAELFDIYEEFLKLINDKEIRSLLGNLREEDVYDDKTFLECRAVSHKLQLILKKVCFEEETPLRDFTREYGVF